MRSRAFSFVELTIAVSVLALLSTVVAVNYGTARRNTRDTALGSDARSLLAAMITRQQAEGTAFVTLKGKPCIVSDPLRGLTPAVGTGCVGMDGFSSGRANGSSTRFGNVTVGDPGFKRTYTPVSIVDALKTDGYLRSGIVHPRSTDLNSPLSPDYFVVLAGKDYNQSIHPKSSGIVTIAYEQENATTLEQNQRSASYFGAFTTPNGPVEFNARSTELSKNVVLVGSEPVKGVCDL